MKKEVKENKNIRIEQYIIEGYKIKEMYYKDSEGKYYNGGRIDKIEVERPRQKYLPEIYVNSNLLSEKLEITDISIKTTVCGYLPVDELKEVIKGYQKAVRVVNKLQEIYKDYICK